MRPAAADAATGGPAPAAGAGAPGAEPASGGAQSPEDFDCALCHDLLFDPCVPPCGHAFCRACLAQCVATSGLAAPGLTRCPLCRRALHALAPEELVTCGLMARLLEERFPEAYARRREEAEAAGRLGSILRAETAAKEEATLPLLVMDAALPRQRFRVLDVSDHLARAVLGAGSRLGVVAPSRRGDLPHHTHGVEAAVEECLRQPDGQFRLQVSCGRIFRILRSQEEAEGHRSAHVQWVNVEDTDGPRPEDVTAAATLRPLASRWQALVERWRPGRVAALLADLGPMPATETPGDLALWLAAMVNPLPPLGVAPEIRPAVLSAPGVAERLEAARFGLTVSVDFLEGLTASPTRRVLRLLAAVPPSVKMVIAVAVACAVSIGWEPIAGWLIARRSGAGAGAASATSAF